MKKTSKPLALILFTLVSLQVVGCSSDTNYKDRMSLMRHQVSEYLDIPVQDIDLSMNERCIVLEYLHSGGCEGMGSHGASDCKETLAICLTNDEACLDKYMLQSNYSYVVPEFSIPLKMILPTTKYNTETHVFVTGSDIPFPQRETMNNIRQMAYNAYRVLPVFEK